MNYTDNTFGLLLVVLALAILPLAAVTVTAFAKISVVLLIVRNALGIQQLPPNIVVYSLSVILSAYIAMPVMSQAYNEVRAQNFAYKSLDDWEKASNIARAPLVRFLNKNTDATQTRFFVGAAQRVWTQESGLTARPDDIVILAPSFLLTQLTRGFEMGFMLFLPFMAIDIIVTTILLALGMSMVSPTSITIPFKLLLFVMLDGWTMIVHGLILSYAQG